MGCTVGQFVGRSVTVDWLVSCSGQSVSHFVGRSFDCAVSPSVGQSLSVARFVARSVGRLLCRLLGWLHSLSLG